MLERGKPECRGVPSDGRARAFADRALRPRFDRGLPPTARQRRLLESAREIGAPSPGGAPARVLTLD